MKKEIFPLGHAEVLTKGTLMGNFDSTRRSYLGLAKIKILPPRGLFLPVLLYHCKGELIFPLCHSCCEAESPPHICLGSDEDRVLTGMWVTPELLKALEKGYTVLDIYKVYNYPQTSEKSTRSPHWRACYLFGDIDMFYKIKT